MGSRRQFLGQILKYLLGVGLLFDPLFSPIQKAFAKAKKVILPKGTRTKDLIQKNPADLDTRYLEVTPLDRFGTMGVDDYETDVDAWRLQVHGHVERPLSLSLDRLRALPPLEREVLLICPGFFANHGRWKGFSIRELLTEARAKEGATHVTVSGPKASYEKEERYPIGDILSDKIFLAYEVNGKKLPVKHGFPLRIVAEGRYGFEWVKYVYRVTVEKVVS
jgi:hypothetical protein